MALLIAPQNFDFASSVYFMCRGACDPVNIVTPDVWRRAFIEPDQTFLLEVKNQGELECSFLNDSSPDRPINKIVSRLLGLHDFPKTTSYIPKLLRARMRQGRKIAMPTYPTFFEAAVQILLGQQISVLAANAVRARFVHTFGNSLVFDGKRYWAYPHYSDVIAKAEASSLQKLGISRVKAQAILGLARFCENSADQIDAFERQPIETALEKMTQLYGIGRWSAEWILLRGLRRLDVVPAGDLVVRKAVAWGFGLATMPLEEEVRHLAADWGRLGGLVTYQLLCAYNLYQQNKEEKNA